MTLPQRDNAIRRSASYGGQVEEIKRLESPPRIRFGASSALLEYAVRPFPHLYKSGNEVGCVIILGRPEEADRPTGKTKSSCARELGDFHTIPNSNFRFV